MSIRSLSVLFALFFALSFTMLAPPVARAQSGDGNARLSGTITRAETGEPLPGASVALPALDRGTSTGPGGTFRLTGLAAGVARVRVSFVGYEAVVREVALERGGTTTLNVALSPSTLQGEEVVVTGTPVAQSTLRSTQDVEAVSPAELETERTAALGDVLEATVSGAASVKTGTQAGKPVLRGLTGNRVKLLKNGVAQEYYQFGVRHFPNTSMLEANRIEVVRGPASLLYGSDALGGAINVLTGDVPTNTGVAGRVGGQYFSNNNERAGFAQLEGGTALGENLTLGVRAGGERRVADNFHTPDAPTFFETQNGGTFGDPKYAGEVPFTNFDQWSSYGQVGLEGDFGSVSLYGEGWQNQQNFVLPLGGPLGNEGNPPLGVGQNLEQYNAQLRASLPVGAFVFKPRLSVQRAVRQSAGQGNTLETIEEAEEHGGFDYPVDLKKNVYTGRLEVLHPAVGSLSGTLGAEALFQDGESTGPVPLEPSSEVYNLGVFAFEELDLDPVTLSGGLRVDYRHQKADPPQETLDALGLDAGSGALENSHTTLSGSVGANYVFADGFSVFSNLGTGFRAPSIFELYGNGQHGGVAAVQRGNPNLNPERTYSTDLGLRARTGPLTGEVVGYYTYFTNYIYLRNTGENAGADGSGAPIYTSGQTQAHLGGVEASARIRVRPWLTVGGEAAFLTSHGDDLEANADGDRLLPLIPADRLGAHVRFEPEGAGMLRAPFAQVKLHHAFPKDAAGRYEPFSQFDGGFGPPFGTASTKGYTLLDMSAGATLALGPVHPQLTVGAKNLLDRAYRNFLDTYKGYALSPGRNVFVKLSVPFGTDR